MITRREFQSGVTPGTMLDVKALFKETYDTYIFLGYEWCDHMNEASKPCCYCKGYIKLKNVRSGKERERCATQCTDMNVIVHPTKFLEDELFEI